MKGKVQDRREKIEANIYGGIIRMRGVGQREIIRHLAKMLNEILINFFLHYIVKLRKLSLCRDSS